MNELALFAGAGGGILGGKLLGWRTVCAVEWDAYARDVLVARQNDGCLEAFPIWDDVQTFDGKPWRGAVDVVSGGFPCQDISLAGKGAGIDGERSGLWGEMRRIIGEVRPRFVLVENSPALTLRGGVRVTADLAALGYVGRNGVLGAVHAGANHKRERIWFVANDKEQRRGARRARRSDPGHQGESEQPLQKLADSKCAQTDSQRRSDECGWDAVGRRKQASLSENRETGANGPVGCCEDVADANGAGRQEQRRTVADGTQHEAAECGGWWSTEPDVGRVAHGVAARVDRLRCLGNGQVPAVVRIAWRQLLSQMNS